MLQIILEPISIISHLIQQESTIATIMIHTSDSLTFKEEKKACLIGKKGLFLQLWAIQTLLCKQAKNPAYRAI